MLQSMGSQRAGHDLAAKQQIEKLEIKVFFFIYNFAPFRDKLVGD